MTQKQQLDHVYDVAAGAPMRHFYDDWATAYDTDLEQHGYRTPARCAEALKRHVADLKTPILDFACGTGLSGQALATAGFECIDGIDLSQQMLSEAAKKNVYRKLRVCEPSNPFDATDRYSVITAVGAIGAGAAPIACLSQAIEHLAPGGVLCVSLNDHSLAEKEYENIIKDSEREGLVNILEDEYGEHLPSIGLRAKVYVLRRR